MFVVEKLAVQEYQTMALLSPLTIPLKPYVAPPPPPVRVKPPQLKLEPKPVFLSAPRLVAPKPVRVAEPEVKTVFQPVPPMEMRRPAKPLPDVKTGVLAAANTPLPRVEQPAAKVQTGGFGNPLGQSGDPRPGRLTVDRVGSFDLPTGSGLGNGTGGAKGTPGIIANAGFGKAAGTTPVVNAAAGGSNVRTGAFGDARTATESARKTEAPAAPAIKPVEILSKPTPAYTEEARRLRKEGEVVLEVVFKATGEVQVLRVLQGLGYGLDESAIQAAKRVRFRPAQQNGQPVDSTAKLHILFELAY
jgi:TonB family protein